MCQASSTCEVEFVDNPMKVFYSGQLMRGTVQLNIVKQKKVRRIYIHVYGAAYASWTEYFWFDFGLQNWCSDYQKTFSGKEVYLNDGTYFVGAPENNNEFKPLNCWQRIFKMVPGVHDYTFEFKLPSDLPTSIEGKHGNIRYTAIFVIDAIYPEKRKTLKIPFTVLRPFDLNADPEFRVIFSSYCIFSIEISRNYSVVSCYVLFSESNSGRNDDKVSYEYNRSNSSSSLYTRYRKSFTEHKLFLFFY